MHSENSRYGFWGAFLIIDKKDNFATWILYM
jgi:hypothetical protein